MFFPLFLSIFFRTTRLLHGDYYGHELFCYQDKPLTGRVFVSLKELRFLIDCITQMIIAVSEYRMHIGSGSGSGSG